MTAAAMFALLHSYSQMTVDSTSFKSRTLQLEEINLVSSYYHQDGNNSAVTGGIGTEKLTDLANVIDVTLTRYDKKFRKNTFIGELGVDHYTSASSDMIDPKHVSSASHADTRIYPSVSWSVENEKKGSSFGIGCLLQPNLITSLSEQILIFQRKLKIKVASSPLSCRHILIS